MTLCPVGDFAPASILRDMRGFVQLPAFYTNLPRVANCYEDVKPHPSVTEAHVPLLHSSIAACPRASLRVQVDCLLIPVPRSCHLALAREAERFTGMPRPVLPSAHTEFRRPTIPFVAVRFRTLLFVSGHSTAQRKVSNYFQLQQVMQFRRLVSRLPAALRAGLSG